MVIIIIPDEIGSMIARFFETSCYSRGFCYCVWMNAARNVIHSFT